MAPDTPDFPGRPTCNRQTQVEIRHDMVREQYGVGLMLSIAYIEGKLSGVVVHSTRVHQRECVAYSLARQHLFACHWTHPTVGHRRSDDARRLARHFNGTQLTKKKQNI